MQAHKLSFIPFCYFALCSFLNAQYPTFQEPGTRSIALGGCISGFTDIYAAFGNQSRLSESAHQALLIQGNQFFGLPELDQLSAALTIPTPGKTALFATFSRWGDSEYNELSVGPGAAISLSEGFSAAAQVSIVRFRSAELDPIYRPLVKLSFSNRITPGLWIHNALFNPVGLFAESGSISLPSMLTLGLSYEASESALVIAEVEKDLTHRPVFRCGVEYRPTERFILRTGASTEGNVFSFGTGYSFRDWFKVDVGLAYHQFLGLSPAVSILFSQK